jgi:hypothetical protein
LSLDYREDKLDKRHGPIQTSFPESSEGGGNTISKAWVDTLVSLSYKLTDDPFSGAATGAFVHQSTVDATTKQRSYSADAYYLPAKDRTNLHMITGANVDKTTSARLYPALGLTHS